MTYRSIAIQRASQPAARRHVPMLAIAGDSAAGKSTFTRGLVAALGPNRLSALCVDDYHKYDREERKQVPFTPLHPECNYMDIMEQHLQLLGMGEPILKPVYDHDTGSLTRPVYFEPKDFVIAEGLLPLHSKVARACFDLTVYLDPPEYIRRQWKIKRDTRQRGYTESAVLEELARREEDAARYIRPQRRHADMVIRFAPIEERHETATSPLSATILLRPTAPHPDLSQILTADKMSAVHLSLKRDEDGKPVDALHVHAWAPRELSRAVEEEIWSQLDTDDPLPDNLGELESGLRSEPLAICQLLMAYHLLSVNSPSLL
jgi:phosphoribulokinase